MRLASRTAHSLRVRRPQSYPSHGPPHVALRCAWLDDAALDGLCVAIEGVLAEGVGAPVLCTLVEWCRTSALSVLGADMAGGDVAGSMRLSLPSSVPASNADTEARRACAQRAARWPRTAGQVLSTLCAHAQTSEEARRPALPSIRPLSDAGPSDRHPIPLRLPSDPPPTAVRPPSVRPPATRVAPRRIDGASRFTAAACASRSTRPSIVCASSDASTRFARRVWPPTLSHSWRTALPPLSAALNPAAARLPHLQR